MGGEGGGVKTNQSIFLLLMHTLHIKYSIQAVRIHSMSVYRIFSSLSLPPRMLYSIVHILSRK